MSSASFNDGNHGFQMVSNTGPITAGQSSLETGDITTTTIHYYEHPSHISRTPAGYKRAREGSFEESSSCPDKPRSKRAHPDDDDNSDNDDDSIASYGSEFWREVATGQGSPRNALGSSQPNWNTEGHGSPRDSPTNWVSQSDNDVSSSGNGPESDSDNEEVKLWDNNSDSSKDEQFSDSSSSSEEDSE